MKELTPDEYESFYKKILPYINKIIEISESYLGKDIELAIRFDTDGTFCFMPPYPEPMLVRDEDAEFPRFVDKNGFRHKMVRRNGRIIWIIASN